MNMAEAARMRALEALVQDLERQLNDAVRRIDDLSNAERARSERENQRKRA